MKRINNIHIGKFLGNYFFLFLLLAGIAINYYFQMQVNHSIKKFTRDQESLVAYKENFSMLITMNGTMAKIENSLRESILTHSYALIPNIEKDIALVRHDLPELSARLRASATEEEIYQLKTLVNTKLISERDLIKVFSEKNRKDAMLLLTSAEGRILNNMLNDHINLLTRNIEKDVQQKSQKLKQDKIDLISIDYAIPHLTTFLFLVIAGFTLIKILQVFKLNKNLNVAVQKEKEAQLIKDQFLSNMTHELRTPLNSVLGFTRLLKKTTLRGEQDRFVKSIQTSGEVLLNVINEVLDYSKLQSGYIRFSTEAFNPRDQLQTLADIVSDRIKEKGLTFNLEVDTNLPNQLSGDPGKLVQILLNITGNAIKFTSKGSISVSAKCTEQDNETAHLEFTISDTGVGISKEKLPHIFERFYQIDGGTTRTYAGTGLGLAITQQLVNLQGGKISVKSQEGAGTEFVIKIPFRISNVEFDSKPQEVENHSSIQLNDHVAKLLVVDDNGLNRELASYILRDLGFDADVVASGYEALDMLKDKTYDAVLMDVQMPGMDGREATRKIRNELKLELPVIALTAYSQPIERQRCMEAGMNAYISKPIDENDLVNVLASYGKLGIPVERNQEELLDVSYIEKISHGNRDFIENVVLKVADTLPLELDKLRKAIDENDKNQVNGIAHDMKTTFAVLGITDKTYELTDYLEKWKATPKSKNGKLTRVMGEMDDICKSISNELRKNFSLNPNSPS